MQSAVSLFADPGIVSSLLAQPHTFMEIDHEIFSTVILLSLIQELHSPSADSRATLRKYVH